MIDFFFRSFNLLLRDSAEGSKLIDESEAGKKGGDCSPKDGAARLGRDQRGAPSRIPSEGWSTGSGWSPA